MAKGFIITPEDAKRYKSTLYWIRGRLIKAFENSEDMSLRKIINKHGPVIDELIEELSK